MKNRFAKAADVFLKVLCAISAAGLIWMAVSVLTVKSARSRDNEIPDWNYFSLIQKL